MGILKFYLLFLGLDVEGAYIIDGTVEDVADIESAGVSGLDVESWSEWDNEYGPPNADGAAFMLDVEGMDFPSDCVESCCCLVVVIRSFAMSSAKLFSFDPEDKALFASGVEVDTERMDWIMLNANRGKGVEKTFLSHHSLS